MRILRIIGMLLIAYASISGLVVGQAEASTITDPFWRVDKIPAPHGIYYFEVSNQHPTDSLIGFASAAPPISSVEYSPDSAWLEAFREKNTWGLDLLPNLGMTAQEYFGDLTWEEIFDNDPTHPLAVVYYSNPHDASPGEIPANTMLGETPSSGNPSFFYQTQLPNGSPAVVRMETIGSFTGQTGTNNPFAQAVPEPTTLALMCLGLAGIGYRRSKTAEMGRTRIFRIVN